MKTFRSLLCLLLALLTLTALVPMTVLAAESSDPEPPSTTVTVDIVVNKKTLYSSEITVSDKPVKVTHDTYIEHKKKIYEFVSYELSGQKVNSITIDAYDGSSAWKDKWEDTITLVYKTHKHNYIPSYNRIYHWNICTCGSTTNAVRHVDPATDVDKMCTCGYIFSNNTQLTTLWLTNVRFDTKFNKDTREYTATVVDSYKEPTHTNIRASTFDAMAKVTLPEDLRLHEGISKFEIQVLAEDKTTTGTYTVTVLKPVKVGKTSLYNDGINVFSEFRAKIKKKTAYITIADDIAAKMGEMAAEDSTGILFKTIFSKWSIQQLELTVPASLLTTLAEKGKGDLKVETPYGTTLTVPNADLAALAEGREALTIRIGKDNSFAILAGEESLPLSEKVQLAIPEAE